MDNHVMQIIPGSAPGRCETAFGKGGSIMKKNKPREVIEAKLQLEPVHTNASTIMANKMKPAKTMSSLS